MTLTSTGRALALAGLALLGSGVLLGFPVLTMLAGAVLGALVFALVVVRPHPQLEVRREVSPDRVERGSDAVALLRVRNIGHRPSAPLRAEDPIGGMSVDVNVPALPASDVARRSYDIPTTRRGLLTVGPLTLTRSDPLGLVSARLTAGPSVPVWVHPVAHRVVVPASGHARTVEGNLTDARLLGSQEFHALREYVVGDELRQVHWKTTARTGQLMVREHLDPKRPGLVLALDNRGFGEDLDYDAFEEAVEVTASFAVSALRSGMPCRLLTAGGDDLLVPAGSSNAQPLLDRLAEVDLVPRESEVPWTWLQPGLTGGCLALVGARLDVDQLPALLRAAKEFDLVAAISLSHEPLPPVPGVRVLCGQTAADVCDDWNRMAGR